MRKGQVVYCRINQAFGVFVKHGTLDARMAAVEFEDGAKIVSADALRPVTIDEHSSLVIRYVVNKVNSAFATAVATWLQEEVS